MTATRAVGVFIPGRSLSTGAHVERAGAQVFDVALRHYLAARDATAPGPWAAAKGFADGLVHGFALLSGLERHQADWLFERHTGWAGWVLAGPPPVEAP